MVSLLSSHQPSPSPSTSTSSANGSKSRIIDSLLVKPAFRSNMHLTGFGLHRGFSPFGNLGWLSFLLLRIYQNWLLTSWLKAPGWDERMYEVRWLKNWVSVRSEVTWAVWKQLFASSFTLTSESDLEFTSATRLVESTSQRRRSCARLTAAGECDMDDHDGGGIIVLEDVKPDASDHPPPTATQASISPLESEHDSDSSSLTTTSTEITSTASTASHTPTHTHLGRPIPTIIVHPPTDEPEQEQFFHIPIQYSYGGMQLVVPGLPVYDLFHEPNPHELDSPVSPSTDEDDDDEEFVYASSVMMGEGEEEGEKWVSDSSKTFWIDEDEEDLPDLSDW